MSRHAGYLPYSALTGAERDLYDQLLAEKMERYPTLYKSAAARAGLRQRCRMILHEKRLDEQRRPAPLRDTADTCHCGSSFHGSDHCPACGCEQYESLSCPMSDFVKEVNL